MEELLSWAEAFGERWALVVEFWAVALASLVLARVFVALEKVTEEPSRFDLDECDEVVLPGKVDNDNATVSKKKVAA